MIKNMPFVFHKRNTTGLHHLFDNIKTSFRSLKAVDGDQYWYLSVVVLVIMENTLEQIGI